MILTIALNPMVNRRIKLDKFNISGESLAIKDSLTVGDCGVYSAYVMKLLQGDPYVLGVSGGIGGRFIKNFLNKNRIKSDFLQVDCETKTTLTIVDESNDEDLNESKIISHNNDLTNRDYINIRHKLYHHLDDVELIAVTGDDDLTSAVIGDIHKATKNTKRVVVAATGEALKVSLEDSVFGLILNNEDLDYLGLPAPKSTESINTLLRFQKRHKLKYLIIQDQVHIYGFSRNKVCRVPWITDDVNRVIAKSLMLGGLCISIKRKYPFERMVKMLGAIGNECHIEEYPFVLKRKEIERQTKHIKLHEIYNLKNGFLIGDEDFE